MARGSRPAGARRPDARACETTLGGREKYDFVRGASRNVSHRRGRFPRVAWHAAPPPRRAFATMHLLRLLALLSLALPAALAAQGRAPAPRHPIDWPALEREGVALLRDVPARQLDEPAGNELDAARFLRDFLAKQGIEAQILDTVEAGCRPRQSVRAREGQRDARRRSRSCITWTSSRRRRARGRRLPSPATFATDTSTDAGRST